MEEADAILRAQKLPQGSSCPLNRLRDPEPVVRRSHGRGLSVEKPRVITKAFQPEAHTTRMQMTRRGWRVSTCRNKICLFKFETKKGKNKGRKEKTNSEMRVPKGASLGSGESPAHGPGSLRAPGGGSWQGVISKESAYLG